MSPSDASARTRFACLAALAALVLWGCGSEDEGPKAPRRPPIRRIEEGDLVTWNAAVLSLAQDRTETSLLGRYRTFDEFVLALARPEPSVVKACELQGISPGDFREISEAIRICRSIQAGLAAEELRRGARDTRLAAPRPAVPPEGPHPILPSTPPESMSSLPPRGEPSLPPVASENLATYRAHRVEIESLLALLLFTGERP